MPNGLAHIAIYALTGHIHSNVAVAFIEQALDAYKQILSVDEEIFCKYLATEVLHRWAGKWIDGVESAEQKLKLLNFAMKVYSQFVDRSFAKKFRVASIRSLIYSSAFRKASIFSFAIEYQIQVPLRSFSTRPAS